MSIELLKENFTLVQALFSLILGAILQYMMGAKKGARVLFIIFISTILTALMLWNLLMWVNSKTFFGFVFEISKDSPIIIVALGLSALISMEFMAIVINFLPKQLRKRAMKGLDLEDINDVSTKE